MFMNVFNFFQNNNVLASAKSIEELRKAYPNYLGNVKGLLQALTKYL